MNNAKNMQVLGLLIMVAERERQFRELKTMVDRSFGVMQRFWFVLPIAAAGWAFIVSDDERFEIFEHVADAVLDRVPVMEPLERLITS